MINCDCLKGLIKLREICEENEECVLYLDDLPNISREAVANYTDSERKCVSEVFASVENAAIAALQGRLKSVLASKLGKARAEERLVTGRFKKDGEAIESDARLCGKWIKTGASDYLSIYVESVRLYAELTVGSFIYVFDTFTGDLLDAIPYTSTGGKFVEVPILEEYNSKEGIFIAYDLRDIVSRETESFHANMCEASHFERCCTKHTSCGCNGCVCVEIDPDWNHEEDSLLLHPDCFDSSGDCGIVICYRRRCTYEALICENQELACYLLWYQMGITFYEDKRITKSINAFTHISPEERQRIINGFIDNFNNHLPGFIESIEADGYCFECKATRIGNVLPG